VAFDIKTPCSNRVRITVAGQLPILTGFPILPNTIELFNQFEWDTHYRKQYIEKQKESQGIFVKMAKENDWILILVMVVLLYVVISLRKR